MQVLRKKKESVEQGNRLKIWAYLAEVREDFFFFVIKQQKKREMCNKWRSLSLSSRPGAGHPAPEAQASNENTKNSFEIFQFDEPSWLSKDTWFIVYLCF